MDVKREKSQSRPSHLFHESPLCYSKESHTIEARNELLFHKWGPGLVICKKIIVSIKQCIFWRRASHSSLEETAPVKLYSKTASVLRATPSQTGTWGPRECGSERWGTGAPRPAGSQVASLLRARVPTDQIPSHPACSSSSFACNSLSRSE